MLLYEERVVGGEPRVDVEEYEVEVVEACEGTVVGVAAGIVKGCVVVVWGCGGGDGVVELSE